MLYICWQDLTCILYYPNYLSFGRLFLYEMLKIIQKFSIFCGLSFSYEMAMLG